MPEQSSPEECGQVANYWLNQEPDCSPKIEMKREPESDETADDVHYQPDCSPSIENVKKQPESRAATDENSVHFDERRIKKEQIDIPDEVFPQESDSGDEKKPLLQIEDAKTSTPMPFLFVACTSDFPDIKTETRQMPPKHFVRSVPKPAEEKYFQCDLCNLLCISKRRLRAHIRWHARVRPYKCTVCNLGFTVETDLVWHSLSHVKRNMVLHNGKLRHVCSVCQGTFRHIGRLHIHMRVHTGDKLYNCKLCHKKFQYQFHLVKHEFLHSTRNENAAPKKGFQHQCSDCQKSFKLKESLENHMLWHSGLSPHICQICKKDFVTKSALKVHWPMHTNVQRFACQRCPKRYKRIKCFKKHMLSHGRNSLEL